MLTRRHVVGLIGGMLPFGLGTGWKSAAAATLPMRPRSPTSFRMTGRRPTGGPTGTL
jgi:hypothetical protein